MCGYFYRLAMTLKKKKSYAGKKEEKVNVSHVKTEYLTANDVDKTYGLWVTTVGCQDVQMRDSYPLEGHPSSYLFKIEDGRVLDEYQLVYIVRGKGKLFLSPPSDLQEALVDADNNKLEGSENQKIDNVRGGVNVRRGTLLWLVPGQWHSYRPNKNTGWKEYYIGFQGDFVQRLIGQQYFKANIELIDLGMNEELISLYIRALELAQRYHSSIQPYLSGIVFHMLGLIVTAIHKEQEPNSMTQKIQHARIYMNEHIGEKIDWQSLAQMLGMSYSLFRKEFKRQTGVPPTRYFMQKKIQRAKSLLLDSHVTVKELQFQLGFNTAENFYSTFKKFADGLTPSEYRKKMLEN